MASQSAASQRHSVLVSRRSSRNHTRASIKVIAELEKEHDKPMRCPLVWKYQIQTAEIYLAPTAQWAVAGLICSNFLLNLTEATIDPQKDKFAVGFGYFETFFNVAFTIELVVNMYATWFNTFWTSGWNIFDFVVVSIGLLLTFDVNLPGPLHLLRLMRAFRVFRLFKRIESLKKIMDSLVQAIPGVTNAFGILVLVMSIYSILAVEFWSLRGENGTMRNEKGDIIPLQTLRGQNFGAEYFGNFPKAFYTMFQVLSGDSWSEAITRPMIHTDQQAENMLTTFFFLSFVIINAIILINVVVAVLVQQMLDDPEGEVCIRCEHKLEPDSIYCRKCRQEVNAKDRPDGQVINIVSKCSNASDESFMTICESAAHAREEREQEQLRDGPKNKVEDALVVAEPPLIGYIPTLTLNRDPDSAKEQASSTCSSEDGNRIQIVDVVKDVANVKRQLDELKTQLQKVAGLVQRRRRPRCIATSELKGHYGQLPDKDLAAPQRSPELGSHLDFAEAELQLPTADLPDILKVDVKSPVQQVEVDTPSTQVDVLAPAHWDIPSTSTQSKFSDT